MEEALTPQQWRYRLPFFAKEVSDSKVTIHGNTTAVMEQELACKYTSIMYTHRTLQRLIDLV